MAVNPIGKLRTFDTGAIRTTDSDDTRYDLVSEIGLERLARTYAEGCEKYGDHIWRKGIPFSNIINHVLAHLNKFKQGNMSEDHLAHAAWGLFALMEFTVTHPELNDLYGHRREDTKAEGVYCQEDETFEEAFGRSKRTAVGSRDSAAAD